MKYPYLVFALLCFGLTPTYSQFIEKPVTGNLNNIYFYNTQIGFLSGSGIKKTVDGGETWTKIKFTGLDSILYISQVNHRFHFFDGLNGIAVTKSIFTASGAAMKTSDGGITWQLVFVDEQLESPYSDGFNDVHFFDQNNGFAVGGEGRRIITHDGGNTWTRSDLPVKVDYFKIIFRNSLVGFVLGLEGTKLKTTDGGVTWAATNDQHTAAFFIDALTAYDVTPTDIFKTTDGGVTWTKYLNGIPGNNRRLVYADLQTAYIEGSYEGNRIFLITHDGGNRWEPSEEVFIRSFFNDVYFQDANTGFVCAEDYLGKTTNGLGLTVPVAYFSYQFAGQTSCLGDVVQFSNHGVESYQHRWYINDQLASTDYNFEKTFNSYGTYEIKLETSHNGITSTFVKQLNFYSPETYPPIDLSHGGGVCANTQFNLVVFNDNYGLDYEVWFEGQLLEVETVKSVYDGRRWFTFVEGLPHSGELIFKTSKEGADCNSIFPERSQHMDVIPADYKVNASVLPNDSICAGEPFQIVIHNSQKATGYYFSTPDQSGSPSLEGNGGDLVFDFYDWVQKGWFVINIGSACGSKLDSVLVSEAPVKAKFSFDNVGLFTNESLTVTNQSEGAGFNWNFGEGANPLTSNAENPDPVSYSSPGMKIISLNASEASCHQMKDTILHVANHPLALNLQACVESTSSSVNLKKYFPVDSDLSGNILQTGYFLHDAIPQYGNQGHYGMYLHKYDASGNLAWKKEVNPFGVNGGLNYEGSFGRGVTTDVEGNIYVVIDFDDSQVKIDNEFIGYGGSLNSSRTFRQMAVLKYSPDGELLWNIIGYDPTLNGRNTFVGIDIEVDSKGTVYFVTSRSEINYNNGVLKFSATGTEKLVAQNNEPTRALSLVKVSVNGNYLGHWNFGGFSGGHPGVVYGSLIPYGDIEKPRLAIDGNDQVLLAGIYTGDTNLYLDYQFGNFTIVNASSHFYVASFKDQTWTNVILGPSLSQVGYPTGIVLHFLDQFTVNSETQALYLSGHWEGMDSNFKIDGTYSPEFSVVFDGESIADQADSYLLKLNYSGQKEWVNFQHRTVNRGIQLDPATGNLYTIGTADLFGTFDALSGNENGLRTQGKRDPFIAHYNNQSGDLISLQSLGNSTDEVVFSNGDIRCGKFTFIGSQDNETFLKEISLNGDCSQQPPSLTVEEFVKVCENNSVQVHASGASFYRWISSPDISDVTSAEPLITPQPSQQNTLDRTEQYTLIGYNEEGCASGKKIKVQVDKPTIGWSHQENEGSLILPVSVTYPPEGPYQWDFGDGHTEEGQSIEHIYSQSGNYDVTISASNTCGPITTTETISIICQAPINDVGFGWTNYLTGATVAFDARGSFITDWLWDFGDGTTSTEKNPTHTYSTREIFTVTLKGSNNCGSTTFTSPIDIICKQVKTTFDTLSQQLTVHFSNASEFAAEFEWDFGDGNSSTRYTVEHTYALPGTYSVCLTITNECSSETKCKNVTVSCDHGIVTDVQLTTDEFTLKVENQSTGAESVAWDFGDGESSSAVSPTHEYAAEGTYSVCFTLSNICGEITECRSVTITCIDPVSNFEVSVVELVVDFTNNSTDASSYKWDFGDGNTSAQNQPTHTYASPGTYQVCLKVSNDCNSETVCKDVIVSCSHGITADIQLTSKDLSLDVENKSTGAESVAWDFGDGESSLLVSPSHQYVAEGTYSVCVTLSNMCGEVEECYSIIIACTNPVSDFEYTIANFDINFTNTSKDATTYEWSFGDGTISKEKSPSHKYQNAGTFHICLTAINDCKESASTCKDITIVLPEEDVVTGEEKEVNGSLTVHPNPTTGLIRLVSKRPISFVSLTNAVGKSESIEYRNNEIDLSPLSAGIYLLQVREDQKLRLIKVIKK